MCDGSQSAQGGVSLPRTKLQFLCDVATSFMVAAVRKDLARFFKNKIHVRDCPIIQLCHGATSPAREPTKHPLRARNRLDDIKVGKYWN
jgi:hypothetical protein